MPSLSRLRLADRATRVATAAAISLSLLLTMAVSPALAAAGATTAGDTTISIYSNAATGARDYTFVWAPAVTAGTSNNIVIAESATDFASFASIDLRAPTGWSFDSSLTLTLPPRGAVDPGAEAATPCTVTAAGNVTCAGDALSASHVRVVGTAQGAAANDIMTYRDRDGLSVVINGTTAIPDAGTLTLSNVTTKVAALWQCTNNTTSTQTYSRGIGNRLMHLEPSAGSIPANPVVALNAATVAIQPKSDTFVSVGDPSCCGSTWCLSGAVNLTTGKAHINWNETADTFPVSGAGGSPSVGATSAMLAKSLAPVLTPLAQVPSLLSSAWPPLALFTNWTIPLFGPSAPQLILVIVGVAASVLPLAFAGRAGAALQKSSLYGLAILLPLSAMTMGARGTPANSGFSVLKRVQGQGGAEETVFVRFDLPKSEHSELKRLSQKLGISQSQVMRKALKLLRLVDQVNETPEAEIVLRQGETERQVIIL